jgi:hypothetical protein
MDRTESKQPTSTPLAAAGPAWRAAAQDGMDMSLIELNLAKTPWERLADHQRSLNLVRMLQNAKPAPHGRSQ